MLVSDFSRFILPEVVGCPDPLLSQAIVQTAFDFCDKASAWDALVNDIPVTSGTASYTLPVVTDAMALRAKDVWINGIRIDNGRISAGAVDVTYDSASGFGVITIRPVPQQDGSMSLRVVYAPTLTATTLPDMLLSRYEQAISAGTKARLMLMPSTAWTNPQLAVVHRQAYESAVTDARIESTFDRASGSIYIPPIRFA